MLQCLGYILFSGCELYFLLHGSCDPGDTDTVDYGWPPVQPTSSDTGCTIPLSVPAPEGMESKPAPCHRGNRMGFTLFNKESNDLDITELSLAIIWLQRQEFIFNSSIEKGGFMVLPVLSQINCTAGKGAFFPIPNRVLPLKDSNFFKLLIMLDIKL